MGAIHLDGLVPGPQALLGLVIVSSPEAESVSGPWTGALACLFPTMSSPSGPMAFLISPTPTILAWAVVAFSPSSLEAPTVISWVEAIPPHILPQGRILLLSSHPFATTARASHTDPDHTGS